MRMLRHLTAIATLLNAHKVLKLISLKAIILCFGFARLLRSFIVGSTVATFYVN